MTNIVEIDKYFSILHDEALKKDEESALKIYQETNPEVDSMDNRKYNPPNRWDNIQQPSNQ